MRLLNREDHFHYGAYWDLATDANTPPLVRESLHYHVVFLDLASFAADPGVTKAESDRARQQISCLLDQWWERFPPGCGEGWNPFTVAYRSQVWLRLRPYLDHSSRPTPGSLADRLDRSLFAHGLSLERSLEHHLGANHLFKDLCALAMLSAHFTGPTSDRWFAIVEKELPKQIGVQILSDGGHYERSPMYHLLVLGDLLDASTALRARRSEFASRWLNGPVQRMTEFLEGILHSDGEIPLFNDSVLGQTAASLTVLERARKFLAGNVANPPAEGMCHFPQSGYTRFSRAGFTLVFDHGPLGPDEQMGHVHNDVLSFELVSGTERLIVDRGVYEYTSGTRRSQCRSIRSHNAPNLEGKEQSEIWSSFRVAQRWHPHRSGFGSEGEVWWAAGAWSRADMGTIERRISSFPEGIFLIEDRIDPVTPALCEIPFRFGPTVDVEVQSDGRWEAVGSSSRLVGLCRTDASFKITVEPSTQWPRFYTELPVPLMIARFNVSSPVTFLTAFGPERLTEQVVALMNSRAPSAK